MRGPGRGRRPLAVLAVLVVLVALAGPALTAVPARAADGDPAVIVVLDSLTPLVPGPEGRLAVRGRVISTARTDLENVTVQLRRSAAPLPTRAALGQAASAPMIPPDGDPDDVALTGTSVSVASPLPPGDGAPFRIVIPFADMGLTTPGAYALGVEVRGRPADGQETIRLGIQRTFLPWFPDPAATSPVRLAWLWPLVGQPDRTARGALLSPTTPDEISPGGRLDRLITLGRRYPETISWIADPALLQTVDDMTRGYQVESDGVAAAGDRESQARSWLDAVAAIAQTVGLRTVPYADVDASAVVRAGMEADVVRAVTSGPGVAAAVLRQTAPGGLYWAPFGRIDPETATVLASAGVTELILSAAALPPVDPATAIPGEPTAALSTSLGTARAVLADPGLTAALSGPQGTQSDVVLTRQRFLAETAVLAAADGPPGRTFVVAPASPLWNPSTVLLTSLLRATRSAPWLEGTTLARILDQPTGATPRKRGGYGARARAAELPASYMAAVQRISERLSSFSSILDNPIGVTEPFAAALLRAESASWRGDLEAGQDLLASIGADLAEDMDGVRVLSEGTITFSGDTGRIPVTITNDLDRSVTVGLTLRGQPGRRLESEQLTGITVAAGRMTSVDITARVIGGEPLTVGVHLLDAAGGDYGPPATIQVTSTAYARAASWVVAIAFVAILVFVVAGVTRRIHKARSSPPEPGR